MIIKEHEFMPAINGEKFPDLFASEKVRNSKEYIKLLVDFFHSQALTQYKKNSETFCQNYRFLKGDLRPTDFYEDEEIKGFYDDLTEDNPLPSYVQQYSILNMPVNTLWGEYIAKPDNAVIKAFDEDSKSEELQYLTDLMTEYATKTIQMRVYQKAAERDADLADEETLAQLQVELQNQVEEGIATFTTQGEKWANRILEALKREFQMKDQSGDAFRDLLIAGRPRLHIYRDKSPTGFKIKAVNPRNVWGSFNRDEKYLKNANFAGLIEVKDITEIIETYDLTKEEVDYLREETNSMYADFDPTSSNLFRNRTGVNSIDYKPQNPMREEEQYLMESALLRNDDPQDVLLNGAGSSLLGQRHIVLTAYYQSKKLVGELVYIDQDGIEQTTLVDENYNSGEHPGELSIEWSYVNEWMKALKVGNSIYKVEPLRVLDYCPILGINFDNKNSEIKSLVDLMKPYQMIFNVCMNQLWELLQKEKGVVFEFNQRHIPTDKDGEMEDSIASFMAKAEELGIFFTDDSLENMKVASGTNTNVNKVHNLARTQEMQSRLTICQEIERRCHALVGINQERLGGVAATQTATGTQAALSSSFAQTQIWFDAQENVMNQAYQAIVDVAQYMESNKEVSTISYLTEDGDRAFFEIAGRDLKFKDFRCLVTSQTEDARKLEALRAMSQNLLQNGADFYTVSKLMVTNSIKEIQNEFKLDKKRREEQQAQQNQLAQQQLEQQQTQFETQQEQDRQIELFNTENDNLQKQLDRLSKEKIAALNAAGRDSSILNDSNNDGLADALAVTTMQGDIDAANRAHQLEQAKLNSQALQQQQKLQNDNKKASNDYELRVRELDLKEKEIQQKAVDSANKLKIATRNKNKYSK